MSLVVHSLGYRPPYSSTKAHVTASAQWTPKLTSLPTALYVFRQNSLFLTNSLSFFRRPPVCIAVGATTQMPPSPCRLWRSSFRTTAWILSRQAGNYSPIQKASLLLLVPRSRPTRPVYSRAAPARAHLDNCMLHSITHPQKYHHGHTDQT